MVKLCLTGSLDNVGFVSIYAKYNGKWVMCFHSRREKWEFPGGHVEKGENPLAAAKRELYEETGAFDAEFIPVWDFEALNEDGSLHNNGRAYYANIKQINKLTHASEMNRIEYFNELPMNVTYDRESMIENINRAEKFALAYYV